MKKRILSIFVTLCMLLTMLPTVAMAEEPQEYTYTAGGFTIKAAQELTEADYSYANGKLTIKSATAMMLSTTATTADYIYVSSSANITLDGVSIDTTSNTNSKSAIETSNGTTLTVTLADGTTNDLKSNFNTLQTYSTSYDFSTLIIQGTGSLSVYSEEYSAICGQNVEIRSGTITLNAPGKYWGTFGFEILNGGDLTIKGGTVVANGGQSGAGIGSKQEGSTIKIEGGHLTANGGPKGPGINLQNLQNSSIVISGGTVIATGHENSAGIGGGNGGDGANITISSGTVIATGGSHAAGIGGGKGASGHDISITGGNVTAIGGVYAAGIGGGGGNLSATAGKDGYNITITNATVYAEGDGAPGIGGGSNNRNGSSSVPYISGKGYNITITDSTVTAKADMLAGSIGSPWDNEVSNIKITGGSVLAMQPQEGYPIGNRVSSFTPKNSSNQNVYLLTIPNPRGTDVKIDGTAYPVRQHSNDDKNVYAYLTGTSHTVEADLKVVTYTFSNGTFTATSQGPSENARQITFDSNGGSGTMETGFVEVGGQFTLPDCAFTAPNNGKYFAGWTDEVGTYQPGASVTVTDNCTMKAIWADKPVVTLVANNGTDTTDTVYLMPGTDYTLPACGFTVPANSFFKGWSYAADGAIITEKTLQVTENITLYAIWGNINDGAQSVLDLSKGSANIGNGTLNAYGPDGTHLTIPDPDGYIITGPSKTNDQSVAITGGTHKLTLKDMTIQVPSGTWGHAFTVQNDAQVEVTLEGTNVIAGGTGRHGLNFEGTSSLVITADSTGSLTVTGKNGSGSPGHGISSGAGNITINGGSINAQDIVTSSGTITINGGKFASGDVSAKTVCGVAVAEGKAVYDQGEGDYPYLVVHATHTAEAEYTSNNNGTHKKSYPCCGVVAAVNESCTYGSDNVCDLCAYQNKIVPTIAFTSATAIIKAYDGETFELPVADDLTITGAEYSDVVFTWTAVEGSLTNGNPVNAGEYTLTATIPATADRTEASAQKDYRINKAQVSGTICDQKVMNTSLVEQSISLPALPDGASYEFSKLYLNDEVEISDHFTKLEMDGTDLVYRGKDSMTVGAVYDVVIAVVGENYAGTFGIEMQVIAHTHGSGTLHSGTPANCATETDGEKDYYVCSCGQRFYDAACTQPVAADADLVIPWAHSLTAHTAVPADCCHDGNIAYWVCAVCDKKFSDAGNTVVDNVVISANGAHTGGDWLSDGTNHWKVCSVGGTRVDEAAHTGGTADCEHGKICTICAREYTERNAANHTGTAEWTQTAGTHAKAYACCGAVVVAEEAHEWENGICSACGYGCQHTGGTATCTGKAVCTGCGHEYGELNASNHASDEFTYTSNNNGTHKKAHACCGVEVTASENCTYGSDRICGLCGYERPRPARPSTPADTSNPNPNSPTVDTDTTVNQDGSVTVTETKKDGTVVETTTGADGSTIIAASKTEEKETYKGTTITTITETKTESADGTTVTEKTMVQTVVDKKGNEITTSKTETKMDNGSTGTTIVAADGSVTTEVKITSTAVKEAAKSDEPVALPMPAVEAEGAVVEIDLPRNSDDVTVVVPVADLTAGTVAVFVKADGTEEVIRKSVADGDGLIVPLDGSATIKVVDAAKEFTDTTNHWAEDAIDFASSHELYQGTSKTEFSPNGLMTRAMLMTVMARLDGRNTDSDAAWYTAGMEWAVEMGISDGSSPMQNISREQIVTMLYRYAKSIGCDVSVGADTNILSYNDALSISDYAFAAMQWACGEGIITGRPGGILAPDGNATRAEVATIILRFVILLTK